MNDIYASHNPRAKSEKESTDLPTRVQRVLEDWSDENWLQFSMWHLHQIRAYIHRALVAPNPSETP